MEENKKTAVWEEVTSFGFNAYQCSNCGNRSWGRAQICPQCGRHMEFHPFSKEKEECSHDRKSY